MEFSEKEIEGFYIDTIRGFYLSKCAENGGEDERLFYENELSEFAAGFNCCLNKLTQKG